jgi:hypothetical protein
VRFDVDLVGRYAGEPCGVLDLSLTGARVSVAGSSPEFVGRREQLEFDLAGHTLTIEGETRSERVTADGRRVLGIAFDDEVTAERAELALALFRTRALPGVDVDAGLPALRLPAPKVIPVPTRRRAVDEAVA